MIKKYYDEFKQLITQCGNHNLSEYTAQCAYYTAIALIPFLILVVTLLQYTSISKDTFIWIIQTIIPTSMADSAIGIVQEVYSKSIGTISISIIFLLWSARKGFYALSKGLHEAYETKKTYFKLQLTSVVVTFILVILVILILVLSVFGNSIIDFLGDKFSIPKHFINIFQITQVGIYFVLFIVFVLMYRFIPGHKVKLIKHIPGAIIATLGWYFSSMFFSIFIDTFKGFSIMYGSLTSITLALMWVYFCMYIILFGAEINNYRIKKERKEYLKNIFGDTFQKQLGVFGGVPKCFIL